MKLKEHWEHVFTTKKIEEVSWYQPKPETSLNFFSENNISKNASILEVGGGDSFLMDFLASKFHKIEYYINIYHLNLGETEIKNYGYTYGLIINSVLFLYLIFVFVLIIVSILSFIRKYSVIPIVGAMCCMYLMIEIPPVSWLWFFVWMTIGLVFYSFYGRRKSLLAKEEGVS